MLKDSSITVGNTVIDGRIWMAPLAGFTDLPFRIMAHEFGCAFSFTEMVSAKGLKYGGKSIELLSADIREGRSAVQLFGSDPQILSEAAKIVYGEGLGRDMLNINMGCPMPKIVNNGDGSALLKDLTLCGRIIESLAKATPLPVSVKCRRGFHRGEDVSEELARIAESAGACALILHGRTRDQMYSGKADWDCVKRAASAVRIPVFGNGDILSREEAFARMAETSCAGVMIGRGALGDPFIFADKAPSNVERYAALEKHVRLAVELLPEKTAVLRMRKQAANYVHGAKGSAAARTKMHQALTAEELLEPARQVLLY